MRINYFKLFTVAVLIMSFKLFVTNESKSNSLTLFHSCLTHVYKVQIQTPIFSFVSTKCDKFITHLIYKPTNISFQNINERRIQIFYVVLCGIYNGA